MIVKNRLQGEASDLGSEIRKVSEVPIAIKILSPYHLEPQLLNLLEYQL